MKERMKKLLSEFLKDSKRSDRELAKFLGVSQPTITRTRHRLIEEGVVREFTVIPDFTKMGYEIMAISCVKVKVPMMTELRKKTEKWMNKYPNVIFSSMAEGMGKNAVIISLHKNYTDYSNFLADFRLEWRDYVQESNSMLITLEERAVKPLSLKYLAES
jgi:DNA-binding Lrp family transcriptional regulator